MNTANSANNDDTKDTVTRTT